MKQFKINKLYLTQGELLDENVFCLPNGAIPLTMEISESSCFESDCEIVENRWVLIYLVPILEPLTTNVGRVIELLQDIVDGNYPHDFEWIENACHRYIELLLSKSR